MPPKIIPDTLVTSFLKAAEDAQIPAMVVYAPQLGDAKIRVASNVGQERSQGILSWLTRADATAVIDIAKAQHAKGTPSGTISAEHPCTMCGSAEQWDVLEEAQQTFHLALAETAVGTIQRRAKSLGSKEDAPPASPIVTPTT